MGVVDGKVVFDETEQAEVDRIIKERITREKEKFADYDVLTDLAKDLEEFGFSGTPAEQKAAVKAYKAQVAAQKELDELQTEAEKSGKDPELVKVIKALKDELKDIKAERQAQKESVEAQKRTEDTWNKQMKEFSDEFPDIDVTELNKNETFIEFISGSGWSLATAYKKFEKVYGEVEKETFMKKKSKEERSTSGGKSNNSGGSHGLTAEQKATVDEWNRKNPRMQMSYKEYEEKM